MPQIAIVGATTVSGGPGYTGPGVILGPGGGIGTFGDSDIVACVGDAIAPHGPDLHLAATIIEGSTSTFVNGIPVTFAGCACSCACTVDPIPDEDCFVV